MVDETRGLVATGHDVTLGYETPGDLVPRHESGGVVALHLPKLTFTRNARALARLGRSVLRAAVRRPDAIVLNQYHESFFGAAVARLVHSPLVCHLRLFPPTELCGQWRVGVSSVTRFVAVSQAVKDAWVSQRGCDPDSIDVVHDGIDLERFRRYDTRAKVRAALAIPQDAFVILYAGRLDRTKNLEELLRVFAALELPAERARLVVAGRPVDHPSPEAGEEYVRSLRTLGTSLGIESAVHWLGPRNDVPELLSAADMAALFQLFPEPLARAAYESLACGTPIIAEQSGGMTEVLSGEFRRFTFDGRDRAQVLALIREVMELPRTDPDFARRARRHAEEGFSKERMVAGIESAIERAVTTRPLHRGPPMARLKEKHARVPILAAGSGERVAEATAATGA